jgi:hypothetical protein
MDISKLCPKSTLLDGVAIWGKDVKTAQNKYLRGCEKLRIDDFRKKESITRLMVRRSALAKRSFCVS